MCPEGFSYLGTSMGAQEKESNVMFLQVNPKKSLFSSKKTYLNYFKPFWTMKKVYLPEIESNRWPSAFNMEPLVV